MSDKKSLLRSLLTRSKISYKPLKSTNNNSNLRHKSTKKNKNTNNKTHTIKAFINEFSPTNNATYGLYYIAVKLLHDFICKNSVDSNSANNKYLSLDDMINNKDLNFVLPLRLKSKLNISDIIKEFEKIKSYNEIYELIVNINNKMYPPNKQKIDKNKLLEEIEKLKKYFEKFNETYGKNLNNNIKIKAENENKSNNTSENIYTKTFNDQITNGYKTHFYEILEKKIITLPF
jgi:hypothetical protein